MFADTHAVRAFGSANSSHAADLTAVAATLSSTPDAAADAMLGPVAARFLAAFSGASTEASRAVAALADQLAVGCRTAHAAATAYETADEHTGTQVSEVY
jgi:hypothetical protein